MGVIQSFERRLQGAVSTTFARLFGGSVHPAEVAGALQQEAKRNLRKQGSAQIAPNFYTVQMGPSDSSEIGDGQERVSRALSEMIGEYLDQQGWQTFGDIEVALEESPSLHTGQFRISSLIDPDIDRRQRHRRTGVGQMSQYQDSGRPNENPDEVDGNRPADQQGGYSEGGYDPNQQGGPQQAGYEQGGYAPQGYQQGGYDQGQGGYQQGGYDQGQGGYAPQGYDQGGYAPQQGGYDQGQGGYAPQGYQQGGYDPNQQGGYPQQGGYDQGQQGYQQGGYPQQGGYDPNQQGGYQQGGYAPQQGGYDQGQQGYQQGGYDQGQGGYAPQGYDQGGYAPQQGGYDQGQQGGYQQGGYDQGQGGYAPQGYDQGGYAPQQGGYAPQQGGYDQGQQGAYQQGGYDQGQAGYQQGGYDQGKGGQDAYGATAAPPPEQAQQQDATAVLTVDDGSHRSYQLQRGSNVVGRGQDAAFRLPDTSVSRRHIDIYFDGQTAVLHDLGSTNGSTVNGSSVQTWQLAEGDVIRIGHSTVVFNLR